MHKIHRLLKSTFIGLVISLQIIAYPAVTFADTTELAAADPVDSSTQTAPQSTESTATPPADPAASDPSPVIDPPVADNASTPAAPAPLTGPSDPVGPTDPIGPQAPTGAASSTYTKNADGTWGNDQYIWDPVTGQTRPKTPQTYSYNPTTKLWDTTEWYYSPEAGKYLPNVVSVAQNPVQKSALLSSTPAGASISQTGPSSNNNILLGGNTTGTFDMFFDARISNAIGQMSRSGDASVQGNTIGGSASSGDAQSIASLLNLLQSSWGTLGSDDISTFVANVDGNVVGDLMIDPSLITSGSGNSKLNVNVAKSGQINNDVNLNSTSGNATVGGNSVGGDAKSGSASSVANLLNLINSAITAKKSFVGVLNINGDLEGDILLPPGMLQSIIASSGPSSTNSINDSGNKNLNANVNTNSTINNNVTTDASSGNATVGNNTSGGMATSGNANNNITLLNLTGHRVVAKDAMLVFVNVFGNWVGLIMNAPAGSNAVAATGPNSTNTIDSQHNTDVSVNTTENNQINNNIHTAAHSGDANVTGNTVGGNATSGDASAGANILNMIDSTFNISDWFGVLFINVFGTWHGSFGVDTPYGNPAIVASSSSSSSDAPTNSANQPIEKAGVFSFIPKSNIPPSPAASSQSNDHQVAAATSINTTPNTPANASSKATTANNPIGLSQTTMHANWTWTIAGISSALSLLGLERFLTLRRRIA